MVERALRTAPAHAIPEALAAALERVRPSFAALRILVNDYHSRVLLPVPPLDSGPAADGSDTLRIRGTDAGRAFASRRPVRHSPGGGAAAELLFVPVTSRGERMGVLELAAAEPWSDADLDALQEVGEVLGSALKVAWAHTDRYERARRRKRLTLAAELQWQLLPGHACSGGRFDLAGHLEPAYSIGGDNFDWSAEHDHLALTVTNGSGTGIQAALLTSLTVGAMRNARRSGADIAEQASLANDMVHVRYGGREFTETLVLRIDFADGVVHVIDAGSPRILRMRGTDVTTVELEQQLPLGMFPDTAYKPQRFGIEPGDRLVVVSDGVFSARTPRGEFGAHALEQATRRSRLQDAAEVPLTVIDELIEYHEGAALDDDAVVVCLDWR
ncbi:PP2C family protein-serine/threonine phosphatase [Actinomadura algeriensis]|uniref:Serine phosphatase RsbU (Regulator of sigma subunit) n=1 Tax=Actinomadura algeriensis TaxID=1679523 RepID=A0ABR9JI67_9ACTN|nr:GAF domain-containing SpoIIE family protein phosphatase [Actinomadura algeriensis]MBE1530240.1 serine phosphatase RsbU (regulator of sigma subunit) [Actinomadura algeriensis]